MKKISILIVLSVICLMLFAACGKTAAPGNDDSAPAASDNVEKTDMTYVIEEVGGEDKNANGDVIGKCHFRKLVFTNPNSALKMINEKIASESDKFFNEGSGKQYAEYLANLSESEKEGLVQQPYYALYDVQNVYTDDKFVSIQYIWDWFAGGVRNFGGYGYNFDIKTGKEIHFADLFASEADAAKAFSDALSELIAENSDAFFEDAADTVASYDMSSVKFSLDDDSIIIYIDQYEIAPGASGSFTVPIAR